MKYIAGVVVSLIFASMIFSAGLNDSEKKIEWNSPETIDPFHENIDEFLKVDINSYLLRATEFYREKKYKEAAQVYLFLLRYKFDDKVVLYNLSCCYALLDKPELSAKFLMYAVGSGFLDSDHIKNDKDLDRARGKKVFDDVEKMVHSHIENTGILAYAEASSTVTFRYHLPAEYQEGKTYPLVLGLHGNGDNNDRFILLNTHFSENKMFYAAPRGMYEFPASVRNDRRYSWFLQTRDREIWKKSDPLTSEYIMNVVNEMYSIGNIGDVYLMGFSQGAALAYMTGLANPDRIKGIICVGGSFPEAFLSDELLKKGQHLRIMIAHGKKDRAVTIEEAVKAKALFEKHGYSVTYLPYDGGHVLPQYVLKKIAEWIK